ncbi:hypothetical protein BGX38DRAFT_1331828 [Terfezia claveryi]|nr:hypothetical protein BGX38DRAFT_1331828 [Terfezia claveryi]
MKARILLTVTAARPHCAAAAPLLSMSLPHRRFQSSKPKSQLNPSLSPSSSPSSPSSSPSSSSQNDPPNKQPKANSATLNSLLGGLLTDSPPPTTTTTTTTITTTAATTATTAASATPFLAATPCPLHSPPAAATPPAYPPALRTPSYPTSDSPAPAPRRIPRMGPTAGRSVLVQGDVTVAFTRLRSLVQANRVRSDMMKQRFHERPGLKKKRLKRERHRRRFKEAFKRMVGVVLDMKNRGM